jgi:hypothetical protein
VKAPNIGAIPGQQAWALPNLMPFGQEPGCCGEHSQKESIFFMRIIIFTRTMYFFGTATVRIS